jgi:hypothetical protein
MTFAVRPIAIGTIVSTEFNPKVPLFGREAPDSRVELPAWDPSDLHHLRDLFANLLLLEKETKFPEVAEAYLL